MAEATNDPRYEILKSVQSNRTYMAFKQGEMDNHLASFSGEIRARALDVNAAHGDIANIYKSLGRMDGRVARIENRLDIIDEPAE